MSILSQPCESLDYCRVTQCRFKGSHTWQDHKCGTCGKYGHGQMECGVKNLVNDIIKYGSNDMIKKELWCKSINCARKKFHTSSSHLCEHCIKTKSINKCYHTTQDCDDPNHPLKSIDNKTYTHNIICPLCLTDNKVNKDKMEPIYGLDSKCQICVTNNVNYLLDKCKHCIMCLDCAKQIMVIDKSTNNIQNVALTDDYWSDSYALSIMGDNPGKIYIKKYGGMGSTIYIKRDDLGEPLQQFMMHQDSWGQYGPETSEVPQLEAFLEGYTEIISH